MCIVTKKFRTFDPHLPIVQDKVLKKTVIFFDTFPYPCFILFCCCCAKPDIGFNLRYAHCAQSFLNGILKMCSRAQLETIYSLLKKNAQWQMRVIKQSLSVSLKGKLGNFFYWIKVFIGLKLREVSTGNFHRKTQSGPKNESKCQKLTK